MRLAKTRAALDAAEKEYAAVVALQNDPNAFRLKFPVTVAAIDVVTSVLNDETRGFRSDKFGRWWKLMKDDPDYKLVHSVRNAEFKDREDTKSANVEITITDSIRIGTTFGDESTPKEEVQVVPATARASYFFLENREEVLGLLRRYLDRLRDSIIPEAERLTPS